MSKKRFLFILPSAILPYVMLFMTAVVMLSTDNSVMNFIMEKVFRNFGLLVPFFMIAYTIFALILSLVFLILNDIESYDAKSLARTALIIKLVQIPAYIASFILGVIFSVTIFLVALAALYLIINYAALISTGYLNISAVVSAERENLITPKAAVAVSITQLIFCIDVISSIIFYISIKKRAKAKASQAKDSGLPAAGR